MSKTVQLRPIDTPKWHNKKGAESFTRAKVISALVDGDSMTYATGLEYIKKDYIDPADGKTKLTEAEYYGKALKADLSNQFNLDTPHPFWDSKMAKVKLENRTQFFSHDNPLQHIQIQILKASKYVANSMQAFEEGEYPEATHVIYDETEEVEVKASKVALITQLYAASAKLSQGQKIETILLMTGEGDYLRGKNLKGKSENFVNVEFAKLIDTKPDTLNHVLSMDKEALATRALVIEALQKHVLKKDGHKIKYFDTVIGQDIDDVAQYLNNPENQDFKLRIKEQINK